MPTPLKIYCEHGALSKKLRHLKQEKKITLISFPVDPGGRSRHIEPSAIPSNIRWEDLNNISWNEAQFAWNEARPSDKYNKILSIVGSNNRRDSLHVDSAYKTGCACLVSKDTDILNVRTQLRNLLNLPVFSPDEEDLYDFIEKQLGTP